MGKKQVSCHKIQVSVGILPIMWLPLSKKMAAMVGCWWQPTTIV
jgi:hypothetical protein